MEKTIKITIDTAKRWYEGNNEELKELALNTFPELKQNELPKRWEDVGKLDGCYVEENCEILDVYSWTCNTNRNIFKTHDQAKASIYMAMLSQLRDVYRNGWVPEWEDGKQPKYVIFFSRNTLTKSTNFNNLDFLSFQDEKTRDLFLENFEDYIMKIKPLMS